MSEEQQAQTPTPPPLQFDFAHEPGAESGPACAFCKRPLREFYFECNGAHVCEICKVREEEAVRKDGGWSRVPNALLFGIGAAVAGSILYYLFIKVLNIELGLMAIGVGWLVGKAVMRGSNFRGGRKYQILALVLTYFSITFSYVPLMIDGAVKKEKAKDAKAAAAVAETPAAGSKAAAVADKSGRRPSAGSLVLGLGFLILIVLAAPFLAGFSNFLGWIIIGIGLWEAWKFTRAVPFGTSGPYDLKVAASTAEQPAAEA